MELIIGGAFQGKEQYAKALYPNIQWVDGANVSEDELLKAEGILGFHKFVKKELEDDHDLMIFVDKLISLNPDVIITSNEVGYGVVPMDAFDRKFREATGRACTKLAANSSKVTRVVCGIGMVIKNVEN